MLNILPSDFRTIEVLIFLRKKPNFYYLLYKNDQKGINQYQNLVFNKVFPSIYGVSSNFVSNLVNIKLKKTIIQVLQTINNITNRRTRQSKKFVFKLKTLEQLSILSKSTCNISLNNVLQMSSEEVFNCLNNPHCFYSKTLGNYRIGYLKRTKIIGKGDLTKTSTQVPIISERLTKPLKIFSCQAA